MRRQPSPATMTRNTASGACGACAQAKRRCGKQIPRCQRCSRRGIECRYPPRKPTCFVLCEEEETVPVNQTVVPYNHQSHASMCSLNPPIKQAHYLGLSHGLTPVGASESLFDIAIASSWFASPETWMVGRFPEVKDVSSSVADLKRYIGRIHRWLTQWVETGGNQFIHPKLYSHRFPRCIQDAYMALSCYLRRTKGNEQMIFRMVEDRAKQLVAGHHAMRTTTPYPTIKNSDTAPLDPLENIARVQALLTYQVICLYDGDIRLRHLAESHIPILNTWINEMIDQISRTPCLGLSLISPTYPQTAVDHHDPIPHRSNLLWYSWILAESTRRTRLIASSLQAIYAMIQLGSTLPCPGSVMFSTRRGVWEANSAVQWEKLCSEVSVGFVSLEGAERLFVEAEPDDVNEFSRVFLEATFGVERMQRWSGQVIVRND